MYFILVSDDEALVAALRAICGAKHILEVFSFEEAVDGHGLITPLGEEITDALREADVALIDWHPDRVHPFGDLCHHLCVQAGRPVVALSRGGRDDWAAAIAAGADDALGLPPHLPYIEARVAAWRRIARAVRAGTLVLPEASTREDVLEVGPLLLDRVHHRLVVDGTTVALTPRELDLLELLMREPGHLWTRRQILREVWGITFEPDTNTVEVYIHYLRRKLKAHGLGGLIKTKRGRGYRFVLPVDEEIGTVG